MSTSEKHQDRKNTRLQFRFDDKTLSQLDECASIKKTTRSEIVRVGIKKVYDEIKK